MAAPHWARDTCLRLLATKAELAQLAEVQAVLGTGKMTIGAKHGSNHRRCIPPLPVIMTLRSPPQHQPASALPVSAGGRAPSLVQDLLVRIKYDGEYHLLQAICLKLPRDGQSKASLIVQASCRCCSESACLPACTGFKPYQSDLDPQGAVQKCRHHVWERPLWPARC